jgi:hypothetical protein
MCVTVFASFTYLLDIQRQIPKCTVPLSLGLGARHLAVLWSCQRIDVCDSVRLLYFSTTPYLLTYLLRSQVSKYVTNRVFTYSPNYKLNVCRRG